MLGVYVHPADRTVWSGGMVELLGAFGFSSGAARVALMRLINRGLLDREPHGRLMMYTLTGRSRKMLSEGDRRIFGRSLDLREAKTWTILWHTLADDRKVDRTRLARRLRFLGFGSLQDGTWVSPHDRADEVAEVVSDLGLARDTAVVTGQMASPTDGTPPVGHLWPVRDLSDRYARYVAEFGPLLEADLEALPDRTAFMARTWLTHTFRGFLCDDPELPDDLLVRPAERTRAIEVFNAAYDLLAPASDRYFVEVAGSAGRGTQQP